MRLLDQSYTPHASPIYRDWSRNCVSSEGTFHSTQGGTFSSGGPSYHMGALNLFAADLVFGFKTTCKRLQVRFDRGNCSLSNDPFKLNLDGPDSTQLVLSVDQKLGLPTLSARLLKESPLVEIARVD